MPWMHKQNIYIVPHRSIGFFRGSLAAPARTPVFLLFIFFFYLPSRNEIFVRPVRGAGIKLKSWLSYCSHNLRFDRRALTRRVHSIRRSTVVRNRCCGGTVFFFFFKKMLHQPRRVISRCRSAVYSTDI